MNDHLAILSYSLYFNWCWVINRFGLHEDVPFMARLHLLG